VRELEVESRKNGFQHPDRAGVNAGTEITEKKKNSAATISVGEASNCEEREVVAQLSCPCPMLLPALPACE